MESSPAGDEPVRVFCHLQVKLEVDTVLFIPYEK